MRYLLDMTGCVPENHELKVGHSIGCASDAAHGWADETRISRRDKAPQNRVIPEAPLSGHLHLGKGLHVTFLQAPSPGLSEIYVLQCQGRQSSRQGADSSVQGRVLGQP